MFTKKILLTGILACSSAAALAQGPLSGGGGAGGGGFTPPSGLDGGESSNPLPVIRTWHRATVDLRPLADAYTPYACVCAEAQIDNLVRVTAQAKATPTSLPGLAEQTANFLQNQGQPDEGGGDDAEPPVAFEGAGLPAAPGEGGDNSEAAPGASDSQEGETYALSIPADLENQSPLPQPFLVSSIVNADIQITDLSSGGGEQPEDPDEGDSPEDEFEEGEEEFEEEIES